MDADGIKCSSMGPETLQAPELCGTPGTRPGSGVSQRSQTPGASGRGAGHCAAQWERWERLSARSTSGWEWVCQRLGTNGRRLQRPAANGAFAGCSPPGRLAGGRGEREVSLPCALLWQACFGMPMAGLVSVGQAASPLLAPSEGVAWRRSGLSAAPAAQAEFCHEVHTSCFPS